MPGLTLAKLNIIADANLYWQGNCFFGMLDDEFNVVTKNHDICFARFHTACKVEHSHFFTTIQKWEGQKTDPLIADWLTMLNDPRSQYAGLLINSPESVQQTRVVVINGFDYQVEHIIQYFNHVRCLWEHVEVCRRILDLYEIGYHPMLAMVVGWRTREYNGETIFDRCQDCHSPLHYYMTKDQVIKYMENIPAMHAGNLSWRVSPRYDRLWEFTFGVGNGPNFDFPMYVSFDGVSPHVSPFARYFAYYEGAKQLVKKIKREDFKPVMKAALPKILEALYAK